MNKRLNWKGVWPALVTPFFANGEVDHSALETTTRRLVAAGVDGLVACGTTGEGATLSIEEMVAVLQTVKSASAGKPVICGSGSNSTKTTIAMTELVAKAGADAALVVSPYYNKPPADGLIAHYREVSAVGLPVLVYNVPGRTGQDLSLELLLEIAKIPEVIGLKDASRSMEKTMQLREALGEDFLLFSGDDFTILPYLACGGDGVISVVANVDPERSCALVEACTQGALGKARTLQVELLPLIELLFLEANPVPVKALLAQAAFMQAVWRAPLCSPTARTTKAIADYLAQHPELRA